MTDLEHTDVTSIHSKFFSRIQYLHCPSIGLKHRFLTFFKRAFSRFQKCVFEFRLFVLGVQQLEVIFSLKRLTFLSSHNMLIVREEIF